MKIEGTRNVPAFAPVTITFTLETAAEVASVRALMLRDVTAVDCAERGSPANFDRACLQEWMQRMTDEFRRLCEIL